MPGLLEFGDQRAFATGAVDYFTGVLGTVTEGRLLVRVSLEGQQTIAAVDTGAPYFVCEPKLAQLIERRLVDPIENVTLSVRGEPFAGALYRLTLELVASVGESIAISATVFIPTLAEGQIWPWPSFVGWTGVLERMRFAVDPESSLFYFGPLAQG